MKKAIEQVISDTKYKENVMRLAKEFSTYNPSELTAQYAAEVLQKAGRLYFAGVEEGEKIY
jgi:UDP:flavonoid glycosyltransferase YjiC (YdhE family)